MSTTDKVTGFDTDALRRGIEERDAGTLAALYAEDAELRLIDHTNPPGSPRVLRGRAEITAYLEEIAARDMTHEVQRIVSTETGAAYVESCRYPDGTNVLCQAMLDIADGRIVRETGVQAWDETQPAARTAAEQHDFSKPAEVREFELGKLELLRVADRDIGRLVLRPGWRWSKHVKHIAGTDLCEAPHFQYQIAGTLHVQMADGTEFDATPGQVISLPSGHDAWVVGDEDVVVVDWWGASDYARDHDHGSAK